MVTPTHLPHPHLGGGLVIHRGLSHTEPPPTIQKEAANSQTESVIVAIRNMIPIVQGCSSRLAVEL